MEAELQQIVVVVREEDVRVELFGITLEVLLIGIVVDVHPKAHSFNNSLKISYYEKFLLNNCRIFSFLYNLIKNLYDVKIFFYHFFVCVFSVFFAKS
jgi:hypothetical protein